MKNIFGLNKYLKSNVFDGAAFISNTIKPKEEEKKVDPRSIAVIPKYLWSIKIAGLMLAMSMFILQIFLRMDFMDVLEYAPSIYVFLVIGVADFVALQIIESVKRKKLYKELGIENKSYFTEENDIHEYDEEEEEAEAARVKAELGIPETAFDMDFLSFIYKEEEDGPVSAKPFDFMTMEMFAYSDENALHIADYTNVYSFTKDSIKSVEKVEKETTVLGWSKEEDIDSEKYAPYGMKLSHEDFIIIPYYYSVKIEKDGEEYELAVPPHEFDAFNELIK